MVPPPQRTNGLSAFQVLESQRYKWSLGTHKPNPQLPWSCDISLLQLKNNKNHVHGITASRSGPEAHPNETRQPTRKRSFTRSPDQSSNGRRFDHAPQLDHTFKIHHKTLGTTSSEDPQNAICVQVPGDGEDFQNGQREQVLDRGRESTSVRPGTSRLRGTGTQKRGRTLNGGRRGTSTQSAHPSDCPRRST